MPKTEYRIEYQAWENVTFPSKQGMRKYIEAEQRSWKPLLDLVLRESTLALKHSFRGPLDSKTLAEELYSLAGLLDDAGKFNRATASLNARLAIPPPSGSLEGQLILGLVEHGRDLSAIGCYVFVVGREIGALANPDRNLERLIETGKLLVGAAPIALA